MVKDWRGHVKRCPIDLCVNLQCGLGRTSQGQDTERLLLTIININELCQREFKKCIGVQLVLTKVIVCVMLDKQIN